MNDKTSTKLHTFTIHGNTESPTGNPTPYTRTLRGKWRKDAEKYKQWGHKVRAAFLDANPDNTGIGRYRHMIALKKKPIVLANRQKARMHIKITWATENHGDPDNIFKGIADALFYNDKHLDGSFESEHATPGKGGKVQVDIWIGPWQE